MTSSALTDLLAVLEGRENYLEKKSMPFKGETVSIETITSDDARKIIKANFDDNRSIVKANLVDLRADMQSGDFHLGTDAIGFDQNDRLVNGQHRMEVLASFDDLSARFIVVRGLSKESIQVLDLGKRRMIHDRITVAGTKMTGSQSAIIRNSMVDYEIAAMGTEYFAHRCQDRFIKECYEKHMLLLRELTRRYRKVNSSICSGAFIYCLKKLEDNGFLIVDNENTQKFFGSHNEKVKIIEDILDSASHFIELATKGTSDIRMAVPEESSALLLFKRIQAKKYGGKGKWGNKDDLRASIYVAHKFYSRRVTQSLNNLPQCSPFDQSYLVEQTSSNAAIALLSL